MKAGSKAFEAHRSYIPVPVTTRPLEQIELLEGALRKRASQLTHQRGIIPCCCGKSGVESSGFIDHAGTTSAERVKAGFILSAGVVFIVA